MTGCRMVAFPLGAVALCLVVVVGQATLQRLRADREYVRMQRRLGTSLNPVIVLGGQLDEEIERGAALSAEQVEARLAGYSERRQHDGHVYYLYFVVNTVFTGRSGSYIRVTYSEDGILQDVFYQTSDPLSFLDIPSQ